MRAAASRARFVLAIGMAMSLLLAASAAAQTLPQAAQTPPVTETAAAASPPADTLGKPSKSRSDSVIVVKHHFDHREQIITGSVIMTCLALMMVAMNNYNPR